MASRRALPPLAAALLLLASLAAAAPYEWPPGERDGTIESRLAPPAGARRIELAPGSFAAWLRGLPVRPAAAPVRLFDGRLKPRQDLHAAVVDLDLPRRDLQQCADAAMRLRAEYLFANRRFAQIVFHPEPGRPTTLAYSGGADRRRFARYLIRLFADAGTASLAAELPRPGRAPVRPGDLLLQGGHPGHAVVVLDVAEGGGRRYLLLGQSYMPAQDFHILRNLGEPALSPWFDEAALDGEGLRTPEWRPFSRADVRRFGD